MHTHTHTHLTQVYALRYATPGSENSIVVEVSNLYKIGQGVMTPNKFLCLGIDKQARKILNSNEIIL